LFGIFLFGSIVLVPVCSIIAEGYHEGYPIFQDLRFDGEVIHYIYDNSNDEYAGEDKGKETDVCKEIIWEENTQGEIEFSISGCSKNLQNFLISVEKEH
jgi:Domain of unknown function (DUF4362)